MGKVYIAGVGSGDEKLITVRAMECIKEADVIVYDRLANPKFLSFAKKDAEKIDVGKRANKHTLAQWQINELLCKKAKEGKIVLRLKGGDPFVFGRGGEEGLELFKAGIEFEIVPGVSAANAVTAFAGIPLTHRGISSSFHVITGHEDPTKNENIIDYSVIAKLSGTLVFFMGLNNLSSICTNLTKNGKDKSTPVAVISNGTLENQKTVCSTLQNIVDLKDSMESPALIVVGEVVSLRESLNWFEGKQISQKRVLVTRSTDQYKKFASAIEDVGAVPLSMPMIEVRDRLNAFEIKEMYKNIEQYNWIVFTSENAVNIFMRGLMNERGDVRVLSGLKIAVIGSATKAALNKYYLKADITPPEFETEILARELRDKVKTGEKVLLPTSSLAHNSIYGAIKEVGGHIDMVFIYEVVTPKYEKGELMEVLSNIDVVTFTSPSCVKGFVTILKEDSYDTSAVLKDKEVVCIGPITGKALSEAGVERFKCAKVHNVQGVAGEISDK
ncbi:uroporphyrinogen-III C-methyltransferase [Clostridium akagii]|uniref:uroporphyrinogen-III C-methyltransferase n=1 Tax=Clostridium akagii TaxID=91623 RepID=UPI00047BBB82|nr:uroporphyrinogen-III C-methyltransferase [Clostridium akagii]